MLLLQVGPSCQPHALISCLCRLAGSLTRALPWANPLPTQGTAPLHARHGLPQSAVSKVVLVQDWDAGMTCQHRSGHQGRHA